MKKVIISAGILVFSLTIGLSAAIAAKPGGGGCSITDGRIEVSTAGDCTSIQAAIDATNGVDPVVIDVLPGIYTENITMQSNIHLQGAGQDVTTITSPDNITLVTFDNVSNASISGFTLDSPWCSIESFSSSPKIIDNIFTGTGWGIDNSNSSPTIKGNVFMAVQVAINNYNSSSPQITNNVITLDDSDCTQAVLNENSSPTIKDNIIKGFGCNGVWGVNSSAIIVDNIFTTTGGSATVGGDNSKDFVKGNLITGSTYHGIDYRSGSSSTLINNKVTGNAVDIYNCDGCNLSFNTFSTIGAGVNACQSFNVKSDGTAWTCP